MTTGKDCMILEWTLLAVAFLLVATRLTFHRRKGIDWADGFVIVAWLFFLGQTCMDTVLYRHGRFDDKIKPMAKAFGPEYGLATYEETVIALKIYFAENVTYYCEMYCIKAAMLAFYYELIPKCMIHHRRALHVTTSLTAAGWLFTVFVTIFGCNPISSQWKAGTGMCWLPAWAWYTICGLHIGSDLMIYILPLFVLHILDMRLAQKIGVGLTFSIGFACMIFATLVQVSFMTNMKATSSNIFGALEQTWSIVVVCLPALKCLLRGEMWPGVSKVRSVLSCSKKASSGSESRISLSYNGVDIERQGSLSRSMSISGAPKHKPLPVSTVIEQVPQWENAKEMGW